MNTLRLNGFFDWLKRGGVPIDGFGPRTDNADATAESADVDQERDIAASRVEPLPCEPARWGNFR